MSLIFLTLCSAHLDSRGLALPFVYESVFRLYDYLILNASNHDTPIKRFLYNWDLETAL